MGVGGLGRLKKKLISLGRRRGSVGLTSVGKAKVSSRLRNESR